jgi:hypothetical protein
MVQDRDYSCGAASVFHGIPFSFQRGVRTQDQPRGKPEPFYGKEQQNVNKIYIAFLTLSRPIYESCPSTQRLRNTL